MTLTLSCALVPGADSPEYARIAESLGYERAFFYDSPALYPDVWVQLCRAADRTDRIMLGPGVTVASNRHPMTTASAIVTLAQIAGEERVIVAVGTGFTTRAAMGKRALTWRDTTAWLKTVQSLLRGEVVEWDDAAITMLHSPGLAPTLPLDISWLLAADGPKGQEFARQLADGVFTWLNPTSGFAWNVVLTPGTVLEEGEDPGSERAMDAAGHGGGVLLHALHEFGTPEQQDPEWLKEYDRFPPERRHLEMHRGHLVHLNEHDKSYVTGQRLAEWGLALSQKAWSDRFARAEEAGATEFAYQPAGEDIPRELETFAEAFHQYTGR